MEIVWLWSGAPHLPAAGQSHHTLLSSISDHDGYVGLLNVMETDCYNLESHMWLYSLAGG